MREIHFLGSSMGLDAKTGTKLIYTDSNGTDGDLKFARSKGLLPGKTYTLKHLEVGGFSSEVLLEEFPGCLFNSVHFVEDKKGNWTKVQEFLAQRHLYRTLFEMQEHSDELGQSLANMTLEERRKLWEKCYPKMPKTGQPIITGTAGDTGLSSEQLKALFSKGVHIEPIGLTPYEQQRGYWQEGWKIVGMDVMDKNGQRHFIPVTPDMPVTEKEYSIPIKWEGYKRVKVTAPNLEEAVVKAVKQFLTEPDDNYLDDSWEVDTLILTDEHPKETLDMARIEQKVFK